MDSSASNGENTGGLGGNVREEAGTRDTRLLERAIRKRWPIPERFREPLVQRQIKIALDPKSSAREASVAFKAILAAEAQNMEQEAMDNPAPLKVEHSGALTFAALLVSSQQSPAIDVPSVESNWHSGSDPHTNGHAKIAHPPDPFSPATNTEGLQPAETKSITDLAPQDVTANGHSAEKEIEPVEPEAENGHLPPEPPRHEKRPPPQSRRRQNGHHHGDHQ